MATPPKDSSTQPTRVPDGQASPQTSHSPLPNGFSSPPEAAAAPQEGSSQETDAADGTQQRMLGDASAGGSDRISPIFGGDGPCRAQAVCRGHEEPSHQPCHPCIISSQHGQHNATVRRRSVQPSQIVMVMGLFCLPSMFVSHVHLSFA